MPGLGETQLMPPQEYFRMERGGKMIFTMDTKELIFKDDDEFLVKYDSNTNIPPIDDYHDYYVTKVVVSLYKLITDTTNLNISRREKHIMRGHYNLEQICF